MLCKLVLKLDIWWIGSYVVGRKFQGRSEEGLYVYKVQILRILCLEKEIEVYFVFLNKKSERI